MRTQPCFSTFSNKYLFTHLENLQVPYKHFEGCDNRAGLRICGACVYGGDCVCVNVYFCVHKPPHARVGVFTFELIFGCLCVCACVSSVIHFGTGHIAGIQLNQHWWDHHTEPLVHT